MSLICGIDEAGRGPVIGPLVICGVLISEKDLPKLQALNPKDSKLLTPKKRSELEKQIKKVVKDYKIIKVSPKEIDDAVESKILNLNWLEAIKCAEIINSLKPNTVFLDCPSNNINAFSDYLKNYLENKKISLTCSHKADQKYIIVSAASIIAKTTRDSEIEKIKEKIGIDFNSGYPSDKKTQEFLKKYHNKFPDIFRKSWASYKNIKKAKQKSLIEF